MATVGEALNRRADLHDRLAQLEERLRASVLVQEGDEPPEKPEQLLTELGAVCGELERLIARINHTNCATRLPGGATVTEALARRDVLLLRTAALRGAVRAATDHGVFGRYSRSDIRMIRQVRISELQNQIDAIARSQRELDSELQLNNWTTPLIE